MIRAAIVGLGTWGRNLVDSVKGSSDTIRFVAATRTPAKAADFAARMACAWRRLRGTPRRSAIDAVVLATPHTLHD